MVVAHDSVTLTWRDPQDDSITGYAILRRDKEIHAVIVEDTGSSATSYTDNTVAAETSYEYRIRAINDVGLSEQSAAANVTTPSAPDIVLVSNIGQDASGNRAVGASNSSQFSLGQRFTTGDSENGYTLTEVVVNVATNADPRMCPGSASTRRIRPANPTPVSTY